MREEWTRVAFGDVVRQVKDRVNPETSGLERYVAGEHMDTDDLRIRRWGRIGDGYLGPAFHMRFKPGHVLYGSRRTYLRKVALATFEGITANTTFVLAPTDPDRLLPQVLPYVLSRRSFHEFSIRASRGSVNPYVNFSDLAGSELMLPPHHKQIQMAALFDAAERVAEHQRESRRCAERVRRAAIDAAFDVEGWGAGETPLGDICRTIVDGVHRTPTYVEDGIPFLTIENLNRGDGVDFERCRYVTPEDHLELIKRANPERGDVLVSKDGTLGVARVVETDRPFSIFVSVALLKPRVDVVDPWFLRYYFDSTLFLSQLGLSTSGSALKHIHLESFRSAVMPLPSLNRQRELVAGIREADRALSLAASRADGAISLRAQVVNAVWE